MRNVRYNQTFSRNGAIQAGLISAHCLTKMFT